MIAVFDMDRTITRGGTWTPFLLRACLALSPWRLAFAPLVPFAMLAYKARLLTRGGLKCFMLKLLLGAPRREALEPVISRFAAAQAAAARPGALAEIAKRRAAGDILVIATASFDFYASEIAKTLGVTHVVATQGVWRDGRLMAEIEGGNCYGQIKLDMLSAYLAESRLTGKTAMFTDHHSDLPVLAWADEPVAVCPNRKLRRLAETRGWRIELW